MVNIPMTGYRSQLNILQGSGKPVEVTFTPANKVIMAEQGDKIEDIAKKNGVTIPFKCKQVLFRL
jgi:ferredoxin